jgi:hypothetical protein
MLIGKRSGKLFGLGIAGPNITVRKFATGKGLLKSLPTTVPKSPVILTFIPPEGTLE